MKQLTPKLQKMVNAWIVEMTDAGLNKEEQLACIQRAREVYLQMKKPNQKPNK